MLFAELHGKLDPNAPDLERREDILTSTVFGTLLVAGAVDLLVSWINSARHLGPDGRSDHEALGLSAAQPVKYWFWPSLSGGTQPDILVRIGQRLLVIEAKYGSSKSAPSSTPEMNGETADDVSASDQLLREWQAIQPSAAGLAWYPGDLRDAIETCERDLVYLVSARRTPSATRELRESHEKIRTILKENASRLWLLTWQDLHGLLLRQVESGSPAARWIPELARLLDRRRNLAAFLGFAHVLQETVRQQDDLLVNWANGWSKERFSDALSAFRDVDLREFHRVVSVVEAWGAERQNHAPHGYFDGFPRIDLRDLERLVHHLEQQQSHWFPEADDE
jgi:hypothetical protein